MIPKRSKILLNDILSMPSGNLPNFLTGQTGSLSMGVTGKFKSIYHFNSDKMDRKMNGLIYTSVTSSYVHGNFRVRRVDNDAFENLSAQA